LFDSGLISFLRAQVDTSNSKKGGYHQQELTYHQKFQDSTPTLIGGVHYDFAQPNCATTLGHSAFGSSIALFSL
jgi:hypothetical protein